MSVLKKEEVNAVAHLARLKIKEEEIQKYADDLGKILTEIDKINDANVIGDTILIRPSTNQNCFDEDEVDGMITKEEAFLNSKCSNGEYIVVPKVLND